jgi:DNA-binding LacI/PurR family transcriptional regulator
VIRQPIAAIGQKAMLVLLERLKQTSPESYPESIRITLNSELIARESI